MSEPKKLVVIGGGIAGYPAAIAAARLGVQVTLVEKADLGGTCLNRGCIPTKAMLQAAKVRRTVGEAAEFGIGGGQGKVNLAKLMARKDRVVAGLRDGVASLLRAKKIQVIQGEAELPDPRTVKVGQKTVSADAVIVATGSQPTTPPIPGLEKVEYWDSNAFLAMKSLPTSAVIIGGGVVGLEFAQILADLGAKVLVLEMLAQVAPGMDPELAQGLQKALAAQGVEIVTGAKVEKVTGGKQATVHYQVGGQGRQAKAERLIVAAGRAPSLGGIDAAKLGLATEGSALQVDRGLATNLPGVYAAGDVIGGIMLAHLAMAEGECAAHNALGGARAMDYTAIPSCVYTSPEAAWVGLSEEQATQRGPVQVGRFPFMAVGKARVLGSSEGLVKIVAGRKHGELLGVHILGPHATDLIAEAVLALKLECTAEELSAAIHPHPTLSEAMMEAGMSLCGGAVHMP